ncbi:MAG: DUF192 domain-containing protein [Candidatus Omnitrophica bacterium]|nr:DUF192 domain-containing protein [Candidatus Omnitrophota bacterium]
MNIEWAYTLEQRKKGLSKRFSLAENEGMLFDQGRETELSFWMKDTAIPLSIAFIGEDGSIQQIEDMTPYSNRRIRSKKKARYALEVNRGWFSRRNIRPGDTVSLP